MEKVTHKQARRRYMRAFWPAMMVYLVAVLGGTILKLQFDEAPLWLNVTIALGAAVPLIAVLFLMVRYFAETDEYTRLKQLRAFAYGACIIVSAIFVVGFLQMFDVVGYVDVFWFGPAFFLAYGLSYRAMGGEECL